MEVSYVKVCDKNDWCVYEIVPVPQKRPQTIRGDKERRGVIKLGKKLILK